MARRILIACIAGLAGLALLEAVLRLRLAVPAYRSTAIPSHTQPGRGKIRMSERPLAREKPPGTLRVLVLGDSFTWGAGVAFDDAYPARLERALQQWAGDVKVEVMNAGRSGWNTADELRGLDDESLLDYSPDLAVLGFCLNDPEPTRRAERDERGERIARRTPPPGVLELLHRHSRLVELVWERLESTRQRRAFTHHYRVLYEADSTYYEDMLHALTRMRDRVRAQGTQLVLMVFPIFDSPLDGRYPYRDLHVRIARTGHDLGLPVLDLLPSYEGLETRRLAVEPFTDPHPNELAHRIAADALFTFVTDTFLCHEGDGSIPLPPLTPKRPGRPPILPVPDACLPEDEAMSAGPIAGPARVVAAR